MTMKLHAGRENSIVTQMPCHNDEKVTMESWDLHIAKWRTAANLSAAVFTPAYLKSNQSND